MPGYADKNQGSHLVNVKQPTGNWLPKSGKCFGAAAAHTARRVYMLSCEPPA
jgi:hypothetical protein